jgi:DNA-binding XRE family transcriptional regulator
MHPPALTPAETVAFTRAYPGSPDQIRTVRDDLRPLLQDTIVAQFTIRATFCPCGHARIEVEDEGGHWTQPARDPNRGRGLDIVHALATGWGISGDYRARTFWAYLGEAASSPAGTSRSQAALLAQARRAGHRGQWTAVLDSQRLRQLRRLHGLSQEALAYRAGLSPATIGRLEREPRPNCRTRTMILLAAAIGEHPSAIIWDLAPITSQPSSREPSQIPLPTPS